ncbi:MAG: hypothetical protein R3286_02140 [Gammaproteobacteria bacterium]|nr:hypothetical protein [Gammaproteobacteria bacterium]
MDPARDITRLGFQRWYERQMYEAYAWLTTCLLSGVAFTAIIELVGFATPGLTPYLTLVILYFVGLMALMSFRRFWRMLSRAQIYADKATCTRCNTYGVFDTNNELDQLLARCRKCGHEWRMA